MYIVTLAEAKFLERFKLPTLTATSPKWRSVVSMSIWISKLNRHDAYPHQNRNITRSFVQESGGEQGARSKPRSPTSAGICARWGGSWFCLG